jgi:enterobactin synthetase component D
MQLVSLPAPRIFPDFVACRSARLVEPDHRRHHAAGRECASEAIRLLTGQDPAQPIGRGPAGEPLWPPGLTGSITHTGDFVSTAVARSSTAQGIGLDAEHIATAERAGRIAGMVARPEELSIPHASIPFATWITLLFSIKEATFKCLYPIARTRFYYDALRVTRLDAPGTFEAMLLIALPGFPEGHLLAGRFEIDQDRVHAGLCLPRTEGSYSSEDLNS